MAGDVSADVMDWLLAGDPAVRWQVMRDLQGEPPEVYERERARVAIEGWGAQLLAHQAADGSWSDNVYTPKWTSTFYTMQVLRLLGLAPSDERGRAGARIVLGFVADTRAGGETCISGMGLATVAYFAIEDERVERLVEHLLREQMDDGGWNCQRSRGATHASFHTTILALEGLLEWEDTVRPEPRVAAARERGAEFLLAHRLFRSHRTGDVVSPAFKQLSFPGRWHYDVLRGLEYLADAGNPPDARADEAIGILRSKRRKDGSWPVQHRHAGPTYFEMEETGKSSRWNTLRALRVLRWWETERADGIRGKR